MATTVHIPEALLKAVDRRARQLNLSRNRFIVRALEEKLAGAAEWSPGFFEKLESGAADASAVTEMLRAIRAHRGSKRPPPL
jgi:predicted transcriptional regulator